MIKPILSAIFVAAPALAGAATYYSATFNKASLPADIRCEGGGALQENTYRNISDKASWVSARIDASNYAAVCATRGEKGERTGRLIFPAVEIGSADACVVWDARSMHRHLPDSYRVLARAAGADWSVLTTVNSEEYFLTTRRCSLAAFCGRSVEIAFETATPAGEGFMLAIDNVEIGIPPQSRPVFVSETPRYAGEDDVVKVCGTLTNYGAQSAWETVAVIDASGREIASQQIAPLAGAESLYIEMEVSPALGETLEYSVVAGDSRGNLTTLHRSDITRSYYARTAFIDRFSGTWCNNCPPMELTTSTLEREYGEQAVVAEMHVNDVLQEGNYWSGYASEFIFAIPALVANHNQKTAQDANRTEDFAAEMRAETYAGITTCATRIRNKHIKFDSEVTFAHSIDNSSDRYRVGYLLLADAHDGINLTYAQQNSASTSGCGQYYYMANPILPELMYYDNLIIEASTGTKGVAGSLGKTIDARTPVKVTCTVTIPTKWTDRDIRGVALVFDTETGLVLNCAVAETRGPLSGLGSPDGDDDCTGGDCLYDLTGRRVITPNPTPGIYIRNGKKTIINNSNNQPQINSL